MEDNHASSHRTSHHRPPHPRLPHRRDAGKTAGDPYALPDVGGGDRLPRDLQWWKVRVYHERAVSRRRQRNHQHRAT